MTMTDPGDVSPAWKSRSAPPTRARSIERMGIEITEATAERVVGRMPVEGNTQPYGLLHGGASCVLAETLGSIGAATARGTRAASPWASRSTPPTTARPPPVTSPAWPPRCTAGRTLATYEIEITDEQGRRVCTSRLTCMLRDI